ncbi:MAG: hypothetical protein ACRDK0_09050 [Solirubrobacteraceae bacterium]
MAITLVPHPLVDTLAKALGPKAPPSMSYGTGGTPSATAILAQATDVPELVTFSGFLGDTVPQPSGNVWRLLYLDWRLQTWLLVEEGEILHAEKVKDDGAPSGLVDVIWVRADASVRRGSGPQSVEARFLTGAFTRAGDFDASPTGGTLAAATGIFCEARTPVCCYRRSRG